MSNPTVVSFMSMVPCQPCSISQKAKMSATASRALNASEAIIANRGCMSLTMPQRKITGGGVRATRDQIPVNGNLQSLLAVSRPPRTGQKTYLHSNGTVHGQLRQSPLQWREI